MMKTKLHISLFLSILVALSGCTREIPVSSSRVISWNVAVNDLSTKYPSGTSAYSTSNSFGCYAFRYTGSSEADWATAPYTSYISGLQIRYFGVGSTPFWSTLSEYYWPTEANTRLHFASFSPYNTLHNRAYFGGKTKGISIDDYEVPADKVDQHYLTITGEDPLYDDDLMVSNEADVDCTAMQTAVPTTYAFEGVPTLFTHILSRINFNFVQDNTFSVDYYDDQTISIRKVKLNNIYNKGSFEHLSSPMWTNQEPKVSGAVLYDSNIGTAAISKNSGAPTNVVTGYLALPQDIVSGVQQLEVTYRIVSVVSGYLFEEDITERAYLYLPVGNLNWLPNRDYTYTITLFAIQEYPIQFTASCQEWVPSVTGGNETPGQNFHLTPEE